MALPTILETGSNLLASIGVVGGARVAGTAGVETVIRIYSASGLTSSYTRTLQAHATGLVLKATWSYARIGGAGRAELLVKGGLADMDTAVQNEWEVELERGDPVVWYRGRIVGYKHEMTPTGDTTTRLYCEGYLTKLAQIKIDKDYASQTVKVVVTDILDTYVIPNTRIAYTGTDIVGAYTVNSISFKGRTVLEALEMLGVLQGSTEWGVTEGNPKPQFYFLADGSGTSETQVLQLGKDAVSMSTEGSFETGYSTVKVVGGWTAAGAVITGSYTDGAAQTLYGKREKVIHDSAILHADDATRLATNYSAVYANGNGRYHVSVAGPETRIEPDRTSGSIAASKKAIIRGANGTQVTDFFGGIVYKYEQGEKGAPTVTGEVQLGLPDECVQAIVARIDRTVQSLVQQSQQFSQGAAGTHTILSATHTDTAAASFVRGDILVVDLTPKLARLATGAGNSGKFLQSDTVDTAWSAWTLPASVSAHAILYAPSANTVGEIASAANSTLVTDGDGIVAWSTDLPSVMTKGGTAIAGTGANTYTGKQTLDGAPTSDLHAATKLYTDGGGGSVALTDAAPTSLDPTLGKRFTHTAAANRTVNATVGTPDGKMIVYEVKSDSAVARVITFGTNILSTGVLTTPASATLVVSATFVSDGTNYKEISRQIAGI